MEARLKEVFRLLDYNDRGECSFKQLLEFGDFIGVEWTLLYLREAFNVFDATEESIINLFQFLRFTVNELNGLDIQLFNYMVEGFIIYTGFDYRLREEIQNVDVFTMSELRFSVSHRCPVISSALLVSVIFSTLRKYRLSLFRMCSISPQKRIGPIICTYYQ